MAVLPIVLILVSTFLHAAWNLLAHTRRDDEALFVRANLLAGLLGLAPVLWLEFNHPMPAAIWPLVLATGLFQGIYFIGLTMGYRSGDFSIVYPLARALPVLALAMLDMAQGHPPSLPGWLGIALVCGGCLLMPLQSLRAIRREHYLNRTLFWVAVTAAGTVGYTGVDKAAMDLLPPGLESALRYAVLQWLATVPFLWIGLRWIGRSSPPVAGKNDWRNAAIAAALMSTAYVVILWVYPMVPQASYVVALRQFSIVIGVVAAMTIFREPPNGFRLITALVVTVGIMLVGFG